MLRTQRSMQELWLKTLMFALFGYALLGKGFAYLFIGEMILVLGFVIFLQSGRIMLLFSDSVLLLWLAFAVWGFCRTVPFIFIYGFDTVRDAVLWGYGVFTVLIVAFVNSSEQISRGLNTYRKFLRWYLPLLPVLVFLSSGAERLPMLPWGHGKALVKGGDAAVHLVGAGLFLLLFPIQRSGPNKHGLSIYQLIGFAAWSITALLVFIDNRGGFLAMLVPIVLAALMKPNKIGWKVVASGIIMVTIAIGVLETNLVTISLRGRTFNPDQVIQTVESIVGVSQTNTSLEATKKWRLIWWRHIIQYTVFGPYRWTGKGFGVNLTLSDGPPGVTAEDTTLRSPHNGNMSVLARMGVPGMLIWGALNCAFVFRVLRGYRRAERSGSRFWSSVNLWIFCYWLAAFINMNFDVYLEGPQGGIWYWSIIGLGVAALRVQKHETRLLRTQSRAQVTNEPELARPLVLA